jgi:peptidoglycan/xylan/chitin deacetylase (PgdA/CDA1 family)
MNRFLGVARTLVCLALCSAGWLQAEAAVVLIYHRFDDNRYPSTNISLETFRQQLEWFAENRFEVWSASQLVAQIETGEGIPDRVVVITIDDGYRSLLGAAVLLRQLHYPYSVFVSTKGIDQGAPDLLGWEALRQLCEQGAEILNHAVDHDSLLAQPGETVEDRRNRILQQVMGAQRRIDDELPPACRKRIFSYPYGEFDKLAEETLAGAGYTAFGQQSGPVAPWDSPQALPRFPVNEAYSNWPSMRVKLLSLPFPDVLEASDSIVIENPPILRLRHFSRIDDVQCFDGSGQTLDRGIDDGEYRFRAAKPLARGRNRYNCTYRSNGGERYHWLSQFWYVP